MKKILSFLAITAIVTGSFAFTSTNFVRNYCVADIQNGECYFLADQVVFSQAPLYYHDPAIIPASEDDCVDRNCYEPIHLLNEQ